jgi:hypothetical protein
MTFPDIPSTDLDRAALQPWSNGAWRRGHMQTGAAASGLPGLAKHSQRMGHLT